MKKKRATSSKENPRSERLTASKQKPIRKNEGKNEIDEKNEPKAKTSHTLAPVGFWIYPAQALKNDLPEAGLANLASTLMELLGFIAPDDYEPSLLAQE